MRLLVIWEMLTNAIHEQFLHILIGLSDQVNVPRLAHKLLPGLIVAGNQLCKEPCKLFAKDWPTIFTHPARLCDQVVDDLEALAQIYAVCH